MKYICVFLFLLMKLLCYCQWNILISVILLYWHGCFRHFGDVSEDFFLFFFRPTILVSPRRLKLETSSWFRSCWGVPLVGLCWWDLCSFNQWNMWGLGKGKNDMTHLWRPYETMFFIIYRWLNACVLLCSFADEMSKFAEFILRKSAGEKWTCSLFRSQSGDW